MLSDLFISLLQYGRLFVEAFLKLAMPLLDHSFKKHTVMLGTELAAISWELGLILAADMHLTSIP